jgi:hypothetical protein
MAGFFGALPEKNLDQDAILRYAQQNINTFYRHIAFASASFTDIAADTATVGGLSIDAGGGTDHKDIGIVKARDRDATGGLIGTTEAVEQSVTLAIPATWNTYDIEAVAVADYLESGTLTGVRAVDMNLRLTDATGTQFGGQTSQMGTVAPNRFQSVAVGFIAGQTATGNVVVVWTSQIVVDSAQASWDNGTLIATAYRLT